MKPTSAPRVQSAPTLDKALADVECAPRLRQAVRAGNVAVINPDTPEPAPSQPSRGPGLPKPR